MLGLTALVLLSITPLTKPTAPTLTSQFFSKPIVFAHAVQPSPCNASVTQINTWNFTENLAGRDPGSTWIQFKAVGSFWLFKTSSVSTLMVDEIFSPLWDAEFPTCPHLQMDDAWNASLMLVSPTTTALRVPASGNYTLIISPFQGASSVLTSTAAGVRFSGLIEANETWTVTAIA